MATWTYADWEDADLYPTPAGRLLRLRKHLSEVRAAIAANVSSDGKSRDSTGLIMYEKSLTELRKELEQSPSLMQAGGMSKLRRGTTGPGSSNDDDDGC